MNASKTVMSACADSEHLTENRTDRRVGVRLSRIFVPLSALSSLGYGPMDGQSSRIFIQRRAWRHILNCRVQGVGRIALAQASTCITFPRGALS
jgi:hypothetical protein